MIKCLESSDENAVESAAPKQDRRPRMKIFADKPWMFYLVVILASLIATVLTIFLLISTVGAPCALPTAADQCFQLRPHRVCENLFYEALAGDLAENTEPKDAKTNFTEALTDVGWQKLEEFAEELKTAIGQKELADTAKLCRDILSKLIAGANE